MEVIESSTLLPGIDLAQLKKQHPKDAAESLQDLPLLPLRQVLRRLPDEFTAEVIAEFPESLQIQLFESMRLHRVSGIVGEMFSDDAADVLGQLSSQRLGEIMERLDPEDARQISDLLRHPEDSAGGIMQTEFLAVPETLTVAQATEKLRGAEDITGEGLFYIYVVDSGERLVGVLRVRDLLFRRPEIRVSEIMNQEVRAVSVHADQEEIGRLFRDYGFTSVPVVDDLRRLRGVVTADDILHVVEEEATEDMHRMVGLTGEELIDTPWKDSVRNRLPWLYVNLGTAFLAGGVVSLFEHTIAKYATLAIFLPMIAGQSGNTGTQTLTIMVRALALDPIDTGRSRKVLYKEMVVGLINGLCIGIVFAFIGWLWKGNPILGGIIFLAMVLNMTAAATAGVLIPLGLRALRIDPALASGIMLTTITDVLGFFIYLGLATLGIIYFPQMLT